MSLGITKVLFENCSKVYYNQPSPVLVEIALQRKEGLLSERGSLVVQTGKYTGRSPNDRYIVDEPEVHNEIDWGSVNKPFQPEDFDRLLHRLTAYFQGREAFVFDGYAGNDPSHQLAVRFINDLASQSLFAQQVFIAQQNPGIDKEPDFTVICAPGFKADPEYDRTNSEAFVIISFTRRLVIIGGTQYAGEIKKSIFSVLNYLLPAQGVLPMHCAANMGPSGDAALFFGLSGTGKTTLSADPSRQLIGDDEHGWTDNGIFNFEGGCYAKCICLSKENEPQIWEALRFGSLLENVVMKENRELDYDDESLTENTRGSYPLEYIPNAVIPSVGGHPKVIIFLTADAFGVMPPIARLNRSQAVYHFLSGYTSKLAGTERGIVEPQAAFVPCYGAPFLPRAPRVYADMLGKKIDQHKVEVYLVNTGWTGGAYGIGKRISIKHTRSLVSAALDGSLSKVSYHNDPFFKVSVPDSCPGVPDEILNPKNTWSDKNAYDKAAQNLANKFKNNIEKFSGLSPEIIKDGPGY